MIEIDFRPLAIFLVGKLCATVSVNFYNCREKPMSEILVPLLNNIRISNKITHTHTHISWAIIDQPKSPNDYDY